MENYRNEPFGTTPGATTPGAGAGAGQNAGQQGVTDKARDVAHEARQKAGEVAHEARQKAGEQVRTGLDLGKSRAAETLHGVASSLHQSCQTSQDGATRYIKQAGDQVQRAADYLERTDVRDMVRHTEDFARRQPALFIGGAVALGVVAARFLRNSQRQYQQQQQPDVGYEGTWQGMASGPTYERERPLGGFQTGATLADSPSPIEPAVPFGTSSAGASGGAGGGMSAGAGGDVNAGAGAATAGIGDTGETLPPPAGRSTRNRR